MEYFSATHFDAEYFAKLQQLVADVLTKAIVKGATAVEAAASVNISACYTVRLGKVETVEFNRDKYIGVTIYRGKRKGYTSSSDLELAAIEKLIDFAARIAKYTEEDPAHGLADPYVLAKNIANLDLYHPINIPAKQAIAMAYDCEQAALKFDNRLQNSDGASFTSSIAYKVYGNSNGFLAGYPSSQYSLSCTVIGQEQNAMQRDFDYTIARSFTDLTLAKIVGSNAAKYTIARLGAIKLKTCKAKVLFHPNTAKNLLATFIAAISGGNLYRKASFLLEHLNQQVFANFINIKEEPFLLKAIGSTPFDNEGVLPSPRYLVQNGVLQSYVLNSYTARKLGLTTTGNAGGVHNLRLEPGQDDFAALVKKLGTGLIAMELIGQGVNIVTGDYSKGCAGFWVEQGVIQYPVDEITIAGNLKDIFLNILAVGNDLDYRHNIITGSILTAEMTIAGN